MIPGTERVQDAVARAFAPLDATFDLLEQSAEAMHQQAEALEQAARALEQSALLMQAQADVYARTLHALREPSRLVENAAGIRRAGARSAGDRSRRHR